MPDYPPPIFTDLEKFLTEYGWHFRKVTTPQGVDAIIAPLALSQKGSEAVLVSFHIEGEFVMVSTLGLFKDVPIQYSPHFLILNDTSKLVKVYATPTADVQKLNIDLAFELWAETWQQGVFFAFLDMLALGVEKAVTFAAENQIPHETSFVQFSSTDNTEEPKSIP